MKILVTGGAGFIGSHIVDAYVELGHEVIVVDNLSTGKLENINKKAKFYELDIKNKDEIDDLFKKENPDYVFHLAAQINVRESVRNPKEDAEVNIIGLINLLEACKNNNVKKVIFSSSGGAIYGDNVEIPTPESEKENPVSPYGIAKLTCEKFLWFYYKQYGLNFVALRYSNVYGERQNYKGEAGVVAIFINKILDNEIPVINGDGKQTRDYVYVKDVVNANILALEKNVNGVYNIGTGKETNVDELFDKVKKSMNLEINANYSAAMPGEQVRSCLNYDKAKRELNWQPKISIEEGIRRTVDWFRNQKLL